MPGNFSCDSTDVVYLFIAKYSQKHNILEKQEDISDTDLIITQSIRQKNDLPMNFNADGHNINDLNVCILKGNFKGTKHRKLTELQFIINFETNIFGLNKDISFLCRHDALKHKDHFWKDCNDYIKQKLCLH